MADSDRFIAIRRAISDPGSFTPRMQYEHGEGLESVPHWGARAVMEVMAPWLPVLDESERFRVESARDLLARLRASGRVGPDLISTEGALHDHAMHLLALLDKLAPKEGSND